MLRASELLLLKMKLQDYEYYSKPVRVAVVRDMGKLVVDGLELEFRKGIELELPRWIAREMEEQGIVEILEKPLSINDIARIHFSVTSAHTPIELDPLPSYFYNNIREYYYNLDKQIREKYSSLLLEERSKAATYIMGIVGKRLSILLQVLRSPSSIAEIENRLAAEEKILLEVLRENIEKWKEKLIGFVSY